MTKNNEKDIVQLSVSKGDKLFNDNTPFVINIFSPESKALKKKCNVDLIFVIDISGSMAGSKIEMVKKSLLVMIEMMDKNNRIAIILFNNKAQIFYDLQYLTDKAKKHLKFIINEIKGSGGTNISGGLESAINILEKDKDLSKPYRTSSVILLSDGCDNELNDIELVQKLKDLTKGKDLDFTLNTFGYGNDHDPNAMRKLACTRDGNFYFIEKFEKVAECFGLILGACESVISNKASLIIELLNKKCEIKKVFGEEYFFQHEIKPNFFTTTMLQFICGKEFTYVLEFEIKLNDVKEGEDLLSVDFIYPDQENNFRRKSIIYKYESKDKNYSKANKEYIRSQVYSVIDKSLELKVNNQKEKAKDSLKEMKDWLIENNQSEEQNKLFLEDINKALNYYENEKEFERKGKAVIYNNVMENQKKYDSSERKLYSNILQEHYSSTSRELLHKSFRNIKNEKLEEFYKIKSSKKKCLIF